MTSFCTLSSEMLSVFCLHLHELYQAGISPDEALLILSEDAPPDGEKFLSLRWITRWKITPYPASNNF